MRLVGLFVALQLSAVLQAQAPVPAGHDHLTEVACEDVPAGVKRPDFGCFNVGMVSGLHFSPTDVYWHLYRFPSVQAALAVKTRSGIIAEEDGQVWLSEFGSRDRRSQGGQPVAVIGPLQLAAAESYSARTFVRGHAAGRHVSSAHASRTRGLVRARGRAVSGHARPCHQGPSRREHDGCAEHSDGTGRDGNCRSPGIRARDSRRHDATRHSVDLEAVRRVRAVSPSGVTRTMP